MHIHQLLYFPLGDHVGRFGQGAHDAHVPRVDHHLKSSGVEKITHQDTGRVAKSLVGRFTTAPECRFIDHIVVQQGGRVYELHHSGQIESLLALVAERTTHQEQQGRTQTFATGGDDVARNLADQGHFRAQAALNNSVHTPHVVVNEGQSGCGA